MNENIIRISHGILVSLDAYRGADRPSWNTLLLLNTIGTTKGLSTRRCIDSVSQYARKAIWIRTFLNNPVHDTRVLQYDAAAVCEAPNFNLLLIIFVKNLLDFGN